MAFSPTKAIPVFQPPNFIESACQGKGNTCKGLNNVADRTKAASARMKRYGSARVAC